MLLKNEPEVIKTIGRRRWNRKYVLFLFAKQFCFLVYLNQKFACISTVHKNKNPVLEKKLYNFKMKLDNFKFEVFEKCKKKSTNLEYKHIFISKTHNSMKKVSDCLEVGLLSCAFLFVEIEFYNFYGHYNTLYTVQVK